MSTIATMAVSLVAQHEAFSAGMNTAENAVKGFERTHLSLKGVMESVITPSERYEKQVEQLAKWHELGKINAEQYERAMANAAKTMENANESARLGNVNFEKFAEQLLKVGEELLPIVSAAEAVKGVFEGVKGGFEDTGEIGRGAIRLGISPEEFSRLKYAAEVSHVSAQTMEADMGKMLNALQKASDGGGDLAKVFGRMHLNVGELKELEPARAFEEIADAIAHVGNRAERMNDVREIFGRAGTAILPMIENMRELQAESDKVGFTRTAEEVERVEAAEREWARATKEVQAAFMDLAADAVPAVTKIGLAVAHALEGVRALVQTPRASAMRDAESSQEKYNQSREEAKRLDAQYNPKMEGFKPDIDQEERFIEALKREHDAAANLSRDWLAVGETKMAEKWKEEQLKLAEQVKRFEEDLNRKKKALKEYEEYLEEGAPDLYGGKLETPHHKKIADPFDDYGFTLKDYEKFFRELNHLNEEQRRERERQFRDAERVKITPLHGEGDFEHRQSDRKHDATEVGPGVDARFMHSQDDERADRKKQLSLTEELVKLMQEQVNLGPSVVTD